VEESPILRPDSPARGLKKSTSQAALFGFADPDQIKQKVKERLMKPDPVDIPYDFYHTEGKIQEIARHSVFENLTLAVITLNAIYIAIDTDWNRADALADYDWYFFLCEQFFCVYFTGEIVIRFLAFNGKKHCFKDAWFMFDSVLVALMVTETWILLVLLNFTGGKSPLGNTAMLRLLRLLRLSRLVRMLRSLPELMILIKGMVAAMRSVSYVIGLLILILYVFSIAFTQLSQTELQETAELGPTFFPSVAHGMYSLLIYAVFLDDLSDFMNALRRDKWPLVFVALVFICLASMTVMNMLVGVLCEVVDAVAKTEKEEMRYERVIGKLREIAIGIDTNDDQKISYGEFESIMQNEKALKALDEVGVSAAALIDFSDHVFFDKDEKEPIKLDFPQFMEVVMDLRNDNVATVKAMLDLWRKIKDSTGQEIKEVVSQATRVQRTIEDRFSSLNGQVDELHALTQKARGAVSAVAG
jgi:voltage-gated sodium channel